MDQKITLQEQAFMKDLIMKCYRRRLLVFLVNLTLVLVGIYTLVFYSDIRSGYGPFVLVATIVAAGRMILCYMTPIGERNDLLPWKKKDNELETVSNYVYSGAEFEEMSSSVLLQPYFDLI